MKIPRPPHRWRLTPAQAMGVQRAMAESLDLRATRTPIRLVAGLDAAFSADGTRCIGGAVLWDVRARRVVETRVAFTPLRFPYVPGLLSFREAPALLGALRKLRAAPDALMCDGHGFAHPRRFGIACHVGVLTGLPSLGCAKSRLVGEHREPAGRRGSRTRLLHGGELIGRVLRTRDGVRPVFVSVGHRIDQNTAETLVLRCCVGHRLPEPTRLADRLVAETKCRSARPSA